MSLSLEIQVFLLLGWVEEPKNSRISLFNRLPTRKKYCLKHYCSDNALETDQKISSINLLLWHTLWKSVTWQSPAEWLEADCAAIEGGGRRLEIVKETPSQHPGGRILKKPLSSPGRMPASLYFPPGLFHKVANPVAALQKLLVFWVALLSMCRLEGNVWPIHNIYRLP